MTSPPAHALIQALAAGQPEAYAVLYGRMSRSLLRVASAMLRCPDEAEDVVHDVFVDLTRGRHRFLQVEDLDAYVFGALRYAVGARVARRRTEQRHLLRMALSKAEEYEAPLVDDELSKALASLPDQQREVVALKIDGGLTFAQIAEVLQVSPNTAASRYRYAIQKLRDNLHTPS